MITDVVRKEESDYDTVVGALHRQIATEVSWEQIEQLGILGLDEIALKKGHRDFVVLGASRQAEDQPKLLGVLPDRKLETVEKFLLTIPEPSNEQFCRRLQQQGQSPQTALLWDYKSEASVSTTFPQSRKVIASSGYETTRALLHEYKIAKFSSFLPKDLQYMTHDMRHENALYKVKGSLHLKK